MASYRSRRTVLAGPAMSAGCRRHMGAAASLAARRCSGVSSLNASRASASHAISFPFVSLSIARLPWGSGQSYRHSFVLRGVPMKGKANRASRLSLAGLVLVSLSMFIPATSWLAALQMVALLVLLGHLIWMWSHD